MSYVICEQHRRRSACASAQSDQCLCCSLLRQYNISRFYSRNLKTLASFCGCAGRFVSGMVGDSQRHILSCGSSYVFIEKQGNIFLNYDQKCPPNLFLYRKASKMLYLAIFAVLSQQTHRSVTTRDSSSRFHRGPHIFSGKLPLLFAAKVTILDSVMGLRCLTFVAALVGY